MSDDGTRGSDPPRRDSGRDDTIPAQDFDAPHPGPPMPGKRYRLGAELGRGGMGRVVEAFDVQLGRTVALKEVLPNRVSGGVERRFLREVQITARLEHPAIVPLYDSGVTDDGRPFYVMRKVTGRPLDELIVRSRVVADRLAHLPAVLAAIDAVAHAHKRGVIHRDLKPANILVGELGETVVIDWGLAKVVGEEDEAMEPLRPSESLMTQIGSVFGTPGFMAPEQARGEELGYAGDVYALGATLYQLLAGKPPHRGTSATEVLESTMTREVIPLGEVSPGTPPELAAIVEKALAFEVDRRYPDAAALGEDVRRFLAGQLVAAHRYTTRQRVSRFAKKHRGVLAVASFATVAVAGLAWYGVHRILTERDIADVASRHAIVESQRVKEQLAQVQDREERRIIANARALVPTNPTGAIATLKQLPVGSSHTTEARTVAQSAVARGVAFGLQTPVAFTLQAALSPDGSHMFQLTNDGWVRMWDLEHHKLEWQRHNTDTHVRVLWVEHGKLLFRHGNAPPELLDPATVTLAPLPIASMGEVATTEKGERIAYLDADGALHRFDFATRTDVVLPAADIGRDGRVAISPDGAVVAASDGKKHVIVVRADGTELAKHDGAYHSMEFSQTGKLALLGEPEILELELATATWTPVPLPPLKYRFVMGAYLDDELELTQGSTTYAWRNHRLSTRLNLATDNNGSFALAGELTIVPQGDAKLRFASRYDQGEIALPMAVRNLKIIGRPRLQRVIAIGDGIILDLPVDTFVAHVLKKDLDETPHFVGDNLLLYVPSGGDTLRWYDLRAQKSEIVHLDKPGMHGLQAIDERTGTVLMVDMHGSVNGNNMSSAPTRLLLVKHGAPPRTIREGAGIFAVLVEGGGVVFSDSAGKLWGLVGAEEPHELATFAGHVLTVVPRGKLGFAAYTDAGEVLRGRLDSPKVEKVIVRKVRGAPMCTDSEGRVLFALETKVYRWDASVEEMLDFERPVTWLLRSAGGVLVGIDGGEVHHLSETIGGGAPRVLPVGTTNVEVGDDGHIVVGFGQNNSLEVVELPARIGWSVPVKVNSTYATAVLSPTSRVLVYSPNLGADFSLMIALTSGPTDLAAWLDELTNARVDESGFVVWPWQSP